MLVTKITLNNQGRLILRENGKLIVPYEQFANVVMMKHLDGPHGLHLNPESTLRALMESFTIGKEYFGMEKEFILEIVQNCPSPSCRYYKTQVELSQKAGAIGSVYKQDSEGGSSVILRTNFSRNSEFQTTLNVSMPTHSGSPLNESVEDKNNSNQRLQNHTSAKKVTSKLYDSSSSIIPTCESYQLSDFLHSESYENINSFHSLGNSTRELVSLQSNLWTIDAEIKRVRSSGIVEGQEKIIRAFAEVMKNMSRMKTCVRPAMCKPYGKQSETLQKTLVDTIQLIQSLRSFLPPPLIPVSSHKNEDKHGLEHTNVSFLQCL